MATITQSLSDEALELVAGELERKVKIVHAEEEADLEPTFDDAPEDLRRARAAGVNEIMGKPFRFGELLDRIQALALQGASEA